MSPETLWNFSVRVYRLPQVGETCLRLQNEHGLDVNLLLFAHWYGRHHGAIPAQLLDALLAFTQPWAREVVRPLRHARSWMKQALASEHFNLLPQQPCTQLRERIKAAELQSEQLQQQIMEALCEHWLGQQEAHAVQSFATQEPLIAANLRAVAEASAVPFTPALQALLDTLQQAARSD
jgi:uncharacterized protein (TIGR02444 family)